MSSVGLGLGWSRHPLRRNPPGSSEPEPGSRSRVCCSLGGFGFLAFALLVFFLQSVNVSSEQVGVRLRADGRRYYSHRGPNEAEKQPTHHLKLDDFFGADLEQTQVTFRRHNNRNHRFINSTQAPPTTVLIFFLPSDALIRHLLSAGSNDSE